MRHAKSDWNDSSLTDKARPLNRRGRASAPIMAKWVLENNLLPDIILCSSAIRTQQTLELMMQYWQSMLHASSGLVLPEFQLEDSLYLASPELILAVAFGAPKISAKQRVLVLGHNPGMEILASRLRECLTEMPTAAIAVLDSISPVNDWPTDWTASKMWKWRGIVNPREIGSESF